MNILIGGIICGVLLVIAFSVWSIEDKLDKLLASREEKEKK